MLNDCYLKKGIINLQGKWRWICCKYITTVKIKLVDPLIVNNLIGLLLENFELIIKKIGLKKRYPQLNMHVFISFWL